MASTTDTVSAPVAREPHRARWVVVGIALLATLLAALLVVFPDVRRAIFGGLLRFLSQQLFVLLFLTLAGGVAISKLAIKGISLGATAGTLLLALGLSLWASAMHGVQFKLPDFVGSLFFNLFMFAVGMKVGPQFLVGLRQGARDFLILGFLVPLLAAGVLFGLNALTTLPPGIAVGIFAGSNTATPGLGAAQAAYASGAAHDAAVATGNMATAFAFSYCISTVLFVIMLKSLPRVLGRDAVAEGREFERELAPDGTPLPGTALAFLHGALPVSRRTFRVERSNAAGRGVRDLREAFPRITIDAIVRDGKLLRVTDDTLLATGDEVAVLAPTSLQLQLAERVGPEVENALVPPLELETAEIVQRKDDVVGMTLADLARGVGHGLYLNAMFRAGELIPKGPNVVIRRGDVFRVTGSRERIERLAAQLGSIVRPSFSTDTLTLALGLALGAFIGALTLSIGAVKLSLGSVALLLVGVAFSALRTRNPALGGPFPEPARQLFEDLGLNVFVAVLGLNAGLGVVQAIQSGAIVPVLIGSAVVGLLPPLVGWMLGQYGLKMNIASLLGAVAGARCSSPGMRAAQETAHSAAPAIAYPVTFAISNVLFTVMSYLFALLF